MINLKDIIGVVSPAILAALGLIQAYQTIRDRMKNLVSWRTVEKGIQSVLGQMRRDRYYPEAIFAMGRGGAVMAGLISNKFFEERNIPIFMVDRGMIHSNSGRIVEMRIDVLDIISPPTSVLLVAGVNASGSTFEKYSKWLETKGVQKIRFCVLMESVISKYQSDYCYKRAPIDPKKLKMPWYSGGIIDWRPKSYKTK